MYGIINIFIAGVFILPLLGSVTIHKKTENVSQVHTVAVVELFTSEGCSSCPPADRLASEIDKTYRSLGKSVYVLAFHVDYWDYIGWKDRFDKHEFSERQMRYGQKFDLTSIYTPQMIVNGSEQFVGSDSRAAEKAIKEALSTNSEYGISIDLA